VSRPSFRLEVTSLDGFLCGGGNPAAGFGLCHISLSLRPVSQEDGPRLAPSARRSHEAVWKWIRRLSSFTETPHPGRARVAVVDERTARVAGEQAWVWLAMEPRSRRLLTLHLSLDQEHLGRPQPPKPPEEAVWCPCCGGG